MAENENAKTRIGDITAEEIEKLRRKTASVLPDSPSGAGMRAKEIKRHFYAAMLDDKDSLVAFLNRVITEANMALGLIDQALDKDAEALDTHSSDLEAHKALFDALAEAAADELAEHADSDGAHKKLFDGKADAKKDALAKIIGDASSEDKGLMTPEQVQHLETLVELLDDEEIGAIDKIHEVFAAFKGLNESDGNLFELFAEKLDRSHANDPTAHASLFAAVDKALADHKANQEKQLSSLTDRVEKVEDAPEKITIEQANQTFANALKGTASGSAVVLDAVSPIPHDVNVSVESKNLVPLKHHDANNTVRGVTFTQNADGSLTLNGTWNGIGDEISYFFVSSTTDPFILKKGTYIGNTGFTGATIKCMTVDKKYSSFETPKTLDQDTAFQYLYIGIKKSVFEDKVFNGETLYPMLMRGTAAEEYTQPVDDFSNVTLTKYGKNLVDYGNHKVTTSGAAVFNGREITLTQDKDGNSPSIIFYLGNYDDFVGKTLTLSCTLLSLDGATRANDAFYFSDVTTDGKATAIGNASIALTSSDVGVRKKITVTVPEMDAKGKLLTIRHYLVGAKKIGDTFTVKDLQVEIGDTMTEYEEYKELTTYTPNADGTVEGVTSVYPTTTLVTGNDVSILAEYNKDTNKVIENLVSAIISLGGNV